MADQSLSDIISTISLAGGIARPTRFQVTFFKSNTTQPFQQSGVSDPNDVRGLTFFCQKAELPGRAFATSDIRHYGPTYKQPYQGVYNDVTLSFLVGANMKEKYFFEAWVAEIDDPTTQDINFLTKYAADIIIEQLDEASPDGSDATYSARLYDAWPIGIGQLRLDHSANDQSHILDISFSYRRWVNGIFDTESGTASSSGVTKFKGNDQAVIPNTPI